MPRQTTESRSQVFLERPEQEIPERYRRAFAAIERGEGTSEPARGGPFRSAGADPDLPDFQTFPFEYGPSFGRLACAFRLLLPGCGLAIVSWFLVRSMFAPLERVQGSRVDEVVIGGIAWLVLLGLSLRTVVRVRRTMRAREAWSRGAYGYYLFPDALVIRWIERSTVLPRSAIYKAYETTEKNQHGTPLRRARVHITSGHGAPSVTLPSAAGLQLAQLVARIQRWLDDTGGGP